MYTLLHNRLEWLTEMAHLALLRGGKKGIEKESLRVLADGTLSQQPHPKALGSTLTHPAITTDYSEALIELITPPFADISDAIDYLDQVHRFVYANLPEGELLWATSMPCIIDGETNIPIGQYGSSNIGMMKQIYRRGLGLRYGRNMQAISGVHFNYSVPDNFWPVYQEEENDDQAEQDFISYSYMALARNVLRHEWLIAYLFGNSPALCKSFFNKSIQAEQALNFEEFDTHTFFEPYATSLRMSDIGYKNNGPDNLRVSYNSLNEYIRDLTQAIETPFPAYEEKGIKVDGEYQQLNANILQIENEYYSALRPKQVARSGEKPTNALRDRGIQYVELRSLDVNAADPLGVNETTLRFLEAFLLFCLLHESPALLADDHLEVEQNHLNVARYGRKPDLTLQRDGEPILLKEWATELFDQIQLICEILDGENQPDDQQLYSAALATVRERIESTSKTPSAQMLENMSDKHETFSQYGMRKSVEHASSFLSRPLDQEKRQQMVETAEESLVQQKQVEMSDTLSLDEFLANYFAQ